MKHKNTALIALLVTLATIVTRYNTLPSKASQYVRQDDAEPTVPDVMELHKDYALQLLQEECGWETPTNVVTGTDDFIAANHVMAQSIAGNSSCPQSSQEMTITINSGLSPTLLEIQDRGYLKCGIHGELPGFSFVEEENKVEDGADVYYSEATGFDADFCRVIAVAVLPDEPEIHFYTLPDGQERFEAVASGKVDVLFRNTTWTGIRDTRQYPLSQLDFGPIIYHDAQRFMVPKDLIKGYITDTYNDVDETQLDTYLNGYTEKWELLPPTFAITSTSDTPVPLTVTVPLTGVLQGTTVYVGENTTTENNLTAFLNRHELDITVEGRDDTASAHTDYFTTDDNKKAVTSDTSQLIQQREDNEGDEKHIILAEGISREPFAPVVRQDDPQWRDIVTWAIFATIYAEEIGPEEKPVDQDNIESYSDNTDTDIDPRIQRLLGHIPGEEMDDGTPLYVGENLGLSRDFAYRIIKNVGNYKDIFDRNFCPEGNCEQLTAKDYSELRGPNKIWYEGGALSPPGFN